MTKAVVDKLAGMIIGSDALNSEFIWQDLYVRQRDRGQKELLIEDLSGIDIALWDIRGKYFNIPSYQLIIGRRDAHCSTGVCDRPLSYLEEEAVGYVVEQGFEAMKLKVGFGVREDIRITQTLCDTLGQDITLMIDANHAYDAVTAIALSRAVEELDIGWFEELVPPEDLAGYRRVKEVIVIPLAGCEFEFTRYGFRDVLSIGAMDIIQLDICAACGLTECKKIADMAHAFGVRTNPQHVWGSAIGIAAALQPLLLTPVPPLLKFDQREHPIRQTILQQPIVHHHGRVAIPSGPGLGIDVDRGELAAFDVA